MSVLLSNHAGHLLLKVHESLSFVSLQGKKDYYYSLIPKRYILDYSNSSQSLLLDNTHKIKPEI